MMNGRNNGKKIMAVRIVAHTFEIVRIQFSYVAPRRFLQILGTIVFPKFIVRGNYLAPYYVGTDSNPRHDQIHIMTDQNPLQIAVDAIVNCGPRYGVGPS
jgi:small subunit ribosomal protein S5e